VIFGALQVTKVLSTEEAKRAIEGSGKDFGKSRVIVAFAFLGSALRYDVVKQGYRISETNEGFLQAFIFFGEELPQ
jgi:hypothetical protein